jgi:hypothetical protein
MFKKERLKHFSEVVYRELERYGYDIAQPESFKFTINTDAQVEKYGVVDYYPKSDKVLIRNKSEWIYPGLAWINNNLINNRGFYTREEAISLCKEAWIEGGKDCMNKTFDGPDKWIKEKL